ncbi:MAG: hypothetical protein WA825_11125 [Steroidobacteraceae bacterium]
MRLADRIAQCLTPLVVQNTKDGSLTHLNDAAAFAKDIEKCPTRYVLSDELTRLCTALAYSKGARTLACTDLLHVPAQRVWIEWTEAPWRNELALYGFRNASDPVSSGRRGIFIQSNHEGRRGLMRTFWTGGDSEFEVRASSMEAYFDFDAQEGDPVAFDQQDRPSFGVSDNAVGKADILRRCFRFQFERSWQDYYDGGRLTAMQTAAVSHHALGGIAIDIPVVLAFFLLLSTRPNLPRRPLMLERLNRARSKSGKARLLDQIEVFSPLLPEYRPSNDSSSGISRRAARLHHVRGHLVRRGSEIFWRVPHLRGRARSGVIHTRTVTWTIDAPERKRGAARAAEVATAHIV